MPPPITTPETAAFILGLAFFGFATVLVAAWQEVKIRILERETENEKETP